MSTRTVNGTCHHDCPDSCGWTVTIDDGTTDDGRHDDGRRPVGPRRGQAPRQRRRTPTPQASCARRSTASSTACTAPNACCTRCAASARRDRASSSAITWDDALAEIAARLHDVIDTHGAEAVLPFSDAGNQSLLSMMGLSGRFFGVHGGVADRPQHLRADRRRRAADDQRQRAGHGRARTRTLQAHPAVGDEHHASPTATSGRRSRRPAPTARRIVVIDPIRTITAEAIDVDAATSSSSRSPAPTSR